MKKGISEVMHTLVVLIGIIVLVFIIYMIIKKVLNVTLP